MRRLLPALALIFTAIAGGVRAEEGRVLVVVELFTSQGCSSCIEAEEMLHDLAGHDDILPLAMHVDYWDYLGWRDVFASPSFTARQHGYAAAAQASTVYTPQVVVNGSDRVMGTRPMKVAESIAAHRSAGLPVAVMLVRNGEGMTVRAEAPGAGSYLVQLVRFLPEAVTEIERGENAGRTIHHANVVTSLRMLARWDGVAPMDLDVPVEGEEPVAVLVQRAGHGAIIGAAVLR